jgi:[ribosomal protein S18]-alanine N-acetyltransferase
MKFDLMDDQNTITIREMRQEDIPAVQEIDRLSFSLPWPKSAFDYELNENPGSLLWVAEVDEPSGIKKVVGILVVWLIIDEAHIATIATAPGYRRQEIARRLLAAGLKQAAELNINTATLEVRANNTPAINLYLSFGFETVGIRPHYYVDNNEDAFIMTKYHLNQIEEVDSSRSFETPAGGG